MKDFLDVLALVAQLNVNSEYYKETKPADSMDVSLSKAISECKAVPIIGEIKSFSPSVGVIRENVNSQEVAVAMQRGGAVALSVLTEPKQFSGSLETLVQAREAVKLPIIMKDIILNPIQISAASRIGANAVLMIKALFDRGYCERSLNEMIEAAHRLELEVLLETHTETEFQSAVKTDADLIGINNRDLGTLKVDLKVTKRILSKNNSNGKVVISESGIKTPADIRFLLGSGAQAFLIGSAIMSSCNIEGKVKEFVNAK